MAGDEHPDGRHHHHDDGAHRHSHDHEHGDEPDDGHDHPHPTSAWARLTHRITHALVPHSHDAADKIDPAMAASREGMRTLWVSLAILVATTLLQVVVVVLSGSVALLGDAVHNAADALTAVPLGIAFLIGRRPANRRYTYGYGRAEDLAGIAIVVAIAASSAFAAYEAVDRLFHHQQVSHLWAVAVAALVGFAGNEIVAQVRIHTGRRIGSAALVADGMHARTDGFTSLAVLLGAGGAALGWDWADPVVGIAITLAILMVLKDAVKQVYARLMDAVDPAIVTAAEETLREVPGVLDVGAVRLRWIGHELRAEADIVVDATLTVERGHAIAVEAEHELIHHVARLSSAVIHLDHPSTGEDPHGPLAAHR